MLSAISREISNDLPGGTQLSGRLREAGHNIKKTVDDTLQLASARRAPLETCGDLGRDLENAFSFVSPKFRLKRVDISWKSAPFPIQCYLGDVRLVVHELIQNAFKSTLCKEPDQRSIIIKTERIGDVAGIRRGYRHWLCPGRHREQRSIPKELLELARIATSPPACRNRPT